MKGPTATIWVKGSNLSHKCKMMFTLHIVNGLENFL